MSSKIEMNDVPGVLVIGLLEGEVGDIFGRASTHDDVGPLLRPILDFLLLDPIFLSFSPLTMVIVSWISLQKSVKLIECQY